MLILIILRQEIIDILFLLISQELCLVYLHVIAIFDRYDFVLLSPGGWIPDTNVV